MSLTNPEKVVTEQRLNEYHQTILPYLGGMPDIMANKFNKSDLYSTDETMIGRWIDGKPLYQKTISCGALPNNSTKLVAIGVTNLETIINLQGFTSISATDSSAYPMLLPHPDDNGKYCIGMKIDDGNTSNPKIKIITKYNYSDVSGYATIQYTKTTDSPVAIGSDTDYSTTEQIVGTWIDGKPIYQKVVVLSSPVDVTLNTWDDVVNVSDLKVNTLINARYYQEASGATREINVFNSFVSDVGMLQVCSSMNNGRRIQTIVLQYTKTTD